MAAKCGTNAGRRKYEVPPWRGVLYNKSPKRLRVVVGTMVAGQIEVFDV